jgi:hypothetical protein
MKAFDCDVHVVPLAKRFETIENTFLIAELKVLNETWGGN